jgi:transglutaminase-like putative cysteine protease
MTLSRAFLRLGLISLAALVTSCATAPRQTTEAPAVTIDDIAAGIQRHIAEASAAGDGYFHLRHGDKELNLRLVRVHMEYLSYLGEGVSFACVDLVDTEGPVYDVDFFLQGPPGAMCVTQTSIHKVNGQPLYLWKQRRNGTWHRVPVERATPRLLGVLHGRDAFEFTYRVKLPELRGEAKLWLPLAGSDEFQEVEVESIQTPGSWRRLQDRDHGNAVLFLQPSAADSGKTIEIRYRVRRREKPPYPAQEATVAQRFLQAEALVPNTDTFRAIAAEVTRGLTNDLARARAIYDHVIQQMRYARYGPGWGRGDAQYACDSRTGNCSDFHAYFIALARAAGIPARFAIGAAIPSERNDGGIDGYHCWAEFFADGRWVPVDVSEADKNASLADYYFGHHPANRFELSRGRDLVVEPGPASGPINFLAYPVLEVNGEPVKVRTEFLFRRRRS